MVCRSFKEAESLGSTVRKRNPAETLGLNGASVCGIFQSTKVEFEPKTSLCISTIV